MFLRWNRPSLWLDKSIVANWVAISVIVVSAGSTLFWKVLVLIDNAEKNSGNSIALYRRLNYVILLLCNRVDDSLSVNIPPDFFKKKKKKACWYRFLIFPWKYKLVYIRSTTPALLLSTYKVSFNVHFFKAQIITKTRLCFDPLKTHLLYSKTGVYRGIHYFSYFAKNIDLGTH